LVAWAALAVAAVAGVTLYGWALWKIPDRMHLHSAQDRYNARLLVISVGGAFIVVVGLLYTARTYRLSHRGQITERFTKALERLNAEQLYVRVGSVQALGRLIHDSPIHHDDIIEVLTAFIRDRVSVTERDTGTHRVVEDLISPPESAAAHSVPPADVQAALTAIAHRPRRPERRAIALADVDLVGADLGNANLTGADLAKANLANVRLRRADLAGANLRGANLVGADLANSDLTSANLSVADLTSADIVGADLTCTYARSANFTDANLAGADLRGANLSIANFTCAYLSGANLVRAYLRLANLTDANLKETCLRDVRGILSEQLQQARTDMLPRLQGKYDQPRWRHTPGPGARP
jgi:hypothetical protein